MSQSETSRFSQSKRNRVVEKDGIVLLLRDERFQVVDLATKRRIVELLPVQGEWGIQTFDLVMTPVRRPPITVENVEALMAELVLVEMKSSRKPIRNAALNGFFFGATEREYNLARLLGDRYMFAFVVLNGDNDYGVPFAVLLTLAEVEEITRQKRTQFQVNLRTDTPDTQADHLTEAGRVFRAPEDLAVLREERDTQ